MTEESSFGEWLIGERVRRGWTQDQLAEKLGCSRITVSRWENNKQLPPAYNRKQLVTLFGLSEREANALYLAAMQPLPKIENVELNQKKSDNVTSTQVPPIADPIIDNLPFRPNPFFTGREMELKQLRTQLQETGTATITQPVSISGLGGIGKTELALEYAHIHYPKTYRTALWVKAETKETLLASFSSLAETLGLPEKNEQEVNQHVEAVKRWLKEHTGWLLIMDNADDLSLANSFLPSRLLGHVLFTTRSQLVSDSDIAVQIMVEEMEAKQGLDFFLRRSGIVQNKTNLDAACQIVELLDGLPLALDQAGAYIRTGVSCADYLERYSEHRHRLLSKRRLAVDESSEQTRHPDSAAVTFALIFQNVYDEHPLAADILHFCAFLHPDAIPVELFHHDESFKPDMLELDEAVAILQRYSLIKRNTQKQTLSIHRLVQAVIIDTLSPEVRMQWRERIMRTLNATFPKGDFKKWEQCERLVPHVLVSITWTEHDLPLTQEASELLLKAGFYLRKRGQYSQAEPLLVRALSIREQQLGAEHLNTAESLQSLAELYRRQGKSEEAEVLFLRVLSIRKKLLGDEHPGIASVLHDLARLYDDQGKYEQAERLFLSVLNIQGPYLGPDNPDTALSLHNLAALYWRQGKYEQAEPLCQRALRIRENQLGAVHPDTARSLNGLAMLYQQQGSYEQAKVLWLQALAIFERQPGIEGFYTAYPLHGLARLMEDGGEHEQAEALYQRALTIQDQQLRPKRLYSKAIRRDFALFLRRIGRHAVATAIEASLS